MAFDETDLAVIEDAILAYAAGTRVGSVTIRDKQIKYAETSIEALNAMRDVINADIISTADGFRFFRVSTSKGLD